MHRVYAVIAIMLLLVPIFPGYSTGSSKLDVEVVRGTSPPIGNGSYYGMKVSGLETGVIRGNRRDRGPPIVYVKDRRLMGVCEEKKGDRVVNRSYVFDNEMIYVSLYRIIEFRDVNNNSKFDGTSNGYDYHITGSDVPVGGLSMNLSWSARASVSNMSDGSVSLLAEMRARLPKEDLRWNRYTGMMEPFEGDAVAKEISVSVEIEMKKSGETGVYGRKGCREGSGTAQVSGNNISLNINITYSIDGWNFKYEDSKLMVQAALGIYREGPVEREYVVNISTSEPRFLEIDGDTRIVYPKLIYGRLMNMESEEGRIGFLRGYGVALSDGENESYSMTFTGTGIGMVEPEEMEGFSVITGSTYCMANLTESGMRLSLSCFVPDDFERTDATPPWLVYAMLIEGGAIASLAVISSYRRYGRR